MPSGNRHYKPQPFWPLLKQRGPQAFVWLGDIIYADKKTGFLPHSREPQPIPIMRQMYLSQKSKKGYREFAESGVIITGVWDDHDYGE
jgi:alkaline phosphatase D